MQMNVYVCVSNTVTTTKRSCPYLHDATPMIGFVLVSTHLSPQKHAHVLVHETIIGRQARTADRQTSSSLIQGKEVEFSNLTSYGIILRMIDQRGVVSKDNKDGVQVFHTDSRS